MLVVEFANLEIGSPAERYLQTLPQLCDKKNPRA